MAQHGPDLKCLLVIGTFLMAGCSEKVAETKGIIFSVEPSTVSSCSPPVVAKVSWNAAASGVRNVKIFVINGETEKLFAEQGSVGSLDTGPWVQPETIFLLKDAASDKQLAKSVVRIGSC